MRISKKKSIILFGVTVLIFVGTLFYARAHQQTSGLDSFAALTRSDPLFYAPFFDVPAFTTAVAELKKSEETLKATALRNISLSSEGYVDSYTKIIQNTPLFPTDFLSLLPEISEATESFNTAATPEKARRLLTLYTRAQQAYEKDAEAMTHAYTTIDSHIPDNRPLYFFFINSATSVNLVQKDFELIHQNSLALKKEIDRRRDCLTGKGSCESLSKQTVPVANLEKITTHANTPFIKDTLPFASTTRDVRGPYTIRSPCWGSTRPHPMYALYATNTDGQISLLPKIADENYYRIVSPTATDAISTKLRSMNLPFYWQAEGTTYECSDLRFYPDLLVADFIDTQLSASSTSELSAYDILRQNAFGLLAPALQSLADFTNLLEASQRISTDFVLSPQFLFTTRSAYSLTYLPFAQSVWRLDKQPAFLLSPEAYTALGAPPQFKTLTQLKREGVSDEAIHTSHINQVELIHSLVK